MDNDFLTDEGHFMDTDDLTQYAKWKIKELIEADYSIKCILNFFNNKEWKRIVRFLLNNSIK